ncbi:putative short transient receptor potential channel 4-associated protein [Plasmopara halstedii]
MEVRRRRRIFCTLSRMQVTGSTSFLQTPQWERHHLRTVADLPASLAASLDAADSRDYQRQATFHGRRQSFVVLLRDIYGLLDSVERDRRKLRLLLQELVQRLLDPNGVHAEDDGATSAENINCYVVIERENFLRLGGAECLLCVLHAFRQEEKAMKKQLKRGSDVRALWETPMPVTLAPTKSGTNASLRKHALNDTMAILRELCYFSSNLAIQLCDKDGLVVYLFQLMGDTRYFDNASGLVEEILAVRDEAFDLTRVPSFHTVLQSLSSRQLAFFCRVLALVVFEPEDRRLLENAKVIKSLELLKLRRNRMMRADNIVDRNHALIYNSPLVLQRLLHVLQVQNFYFALNSVYEPFSSELATSAEFATLLYQTSDRSDWDSIDRLVTHPALESSGDLTNLHRHHQTGATASTDERDSNTSSLLYPHQHSFSVETATLRELIFRNRSPDQRTRDDVEAQVVIKSIVLAPYRVEVLFVLCTLLNGKRKVDFQERLAGMGLVKTLNIMFDKFQWITSVASTPTHEPLHGPGCDCSLDASLKIQFLRLIHNFCDRDYSDNSSKLLLLSEHEIRLMNESGSSPINLEHTDKGLLSKIIVALNEQPADSIYRFWLASCVEAFLRRAAPSEQLFVARTPLLQALIADILSGGAYRSQGSFQSAFDLLGEMTKGNWETLQLFHGLLDNTQFASFMVVILNLVDSNVFIRSMLLSSEKFAKQSESGTFGLADDYEMDRMSEFLTVNLVRLLRDLMTIVTLDDINHENICCLNTAIVILVFQHRRKRLPTILEALRDHEDVSGKHGYVCENFRALLWFWIQYYTPRGRDRLGLEHSSEVQFDEWRRVVSLLCADDGSETALLSKPVRLPPSPYSRLYASPRDRCN